MKHGRVGYIRKDRSKQIVFWVVARRGGSGAGGRWRGEGGAESGELGGCVGAHILWVRDIYHNTNARY